MIGRMSKGERYKARKFCRVRAKTTKADKTKAKREMFKKLKAENLPKKNAQELPKKNAQEESRHQNVLKKKKKIELKKNKNNPTRPSAGERKHYLSIRKLNVDDKTCPVCFVVPRKNMSGLSVEKYYKVLKVDVQELQPVDLLRMANDSTGKKKFKRISDTDLMRDDDDETAETDRKKGRNERQFYTVVWLLVGGDDNFECQWVNAEDVYFL